MGEGVVDEKEEGSPRKKSLGRVPLSSSIRPHVGKQKAIIDLTTIKSDL